MMNDIPSCKNCGSINLFCNKCGEFYCPVCSEFVISGCPHCYLKGLINTFDQRVKDNIDDILDDDNLRLFEQIYIIRKIRHSANPLRQSIKELKILTTKSKLNTLEHIYGPLRGVPPDRVMIYMGTKFSIGFSTNLLPTELVDDFMKEIWRLRQCYVSILLNHRSYFIMFYTINKKGVERVIDLENNTPIFDYDEALKIANREIKQGEDFKIFEKGKEHYRLIKKEF